MKSTSIIFTLFMFSQSALAKDNAPLRKSPFFIDGIHCMGLTAYVEEEQFSKAYADADMAKIAYKTMQQTQCENIFKAYDVIKFQWVTDEELENLSFTLKKSNKFKQVDISIEKSELPNHVHLTGHFVPHAEKHKFKLHVSQSLEKGGDTGNRSSTLFEGKANLYQRGQANDPKYSVGLKYFKTQAKKPLSADELKRGKNDVTMTPEETIIQSRQSGRYFDLNFRVNFPPYSSTSWLNPYLVVGLFQQQETMDKSHITGNYFEYGTEIHPDQTNPKAYFGLSLLYSDYAVGGNEYFDYDNESQDHTNKNILFAGIRGHFPTEKFSAHYSVFRSLTEEMHLFAEVSALFTIYKQGDFSHNIAGDFFYLRQAILPQHRFGLPNRDETTIYYQGNYSLNSLGRDSSIIFKFGGSEYLAKNNLKTPYRRENTFGELGLQSSINDFDLSLALIYGSQRLY